MASDDDEIPETGAIFTFGKTRFAENLANKFWIRDDKVLQLACGDEHSAVITSSGRLYTFGSNDWGQLGHGNTKSYTKPSVVKKLKGDRVKVVACGRSHTLVISESGVFSFGTGADSQLGHGDNKSYNVPTEIEALSEHTVTQVACGAEHSAALTDNGELYMWGSGSEGQLGLGIAECELPTLLKFRSKVTFVACGYYHTAVITELGKLYTFGDNEAGKLGLDDNQCDDTEEPQQVKTLNEPAVYVACGGNHTAVVIKRGSVFSFGSGMHGQLGHGPSFQDVPLPKLVSALQGKVVSAVSCGESHTAVITKNGEMYTFGDGRHGKLGMGDESFSNLFQPAKVGRFRGFHVEQVSCGGCHMLAVASRKHGGIEDSEGSEGRMEDESGGEDVVDGETPPRFSQTVPMLGMSARDKRRKKETEGISLTSSLPPLNRSSLPPLASLGITNVLKKEEIKPITNGKLNPLNRSTLPIISIKSPSPDDEENPSDRLSNSRRLPPRPKRRQKKPEPTSESEEENYGKPRGNTRPTPLPRKQKQTKEDQQNNNGRKFRDAVEKSGSEASDEDSEEDDGNPAADCTTPSRNNAEEVEESEEEESEEEDGGGEKDGGKEDGGKKGGEKKGGEKKGGEKKHGKNGGDKVKDKEDKKNKVDGGNEEDDEEEDETEDEESEDEEDGDEATSSKSKDKDKQDGSEEETEVTKVEGVDGEKEVGEEEDKNKKKKKDNDKDSKKDKKDKNKDKTKEDDEETEDKENEKGRKKKKKKGENEDKVEEPEEEGQEEKENGEDENDGTTEKDEDANKDGKGKKTKKSGICVIL